jgi:hypothetical protein
MSGGSFDYLYSQEVFDLSSETVQSAVESLISEEYSITGTEEVGTDLLTFLEELENVKQTLESRWSTFSSVLKALEWYYSGDAGEEDFRKAVLEYHQKRGER